jgi:hypothetical protein
MFDVFPSSGLTDYEPLNSKNISGTLQKYVVFWEIEN